MWGEMRTAAILAKAVTSDATAIPALTAIRMATLNGAKALGLQHLIGSLQAGKSADFIAVDLNSVEFTPMFDVLSHIVYVADRHWYVLPPLSLNRLLSQVYPCIHAAILRFRVVSV
jgi:5-methylthioadenosine/S-adenosylhomocysteine deaminase